MRKKSPEEGELVVPQKPLPPEEAQALLGEVGRNWWYGQGLGETAVEAGGIVLFPPYALYVLGNAALSVSGYEPIYITDALPEEDKVSYDKMYDTLTSVPGKVNADVAGERFVTKKVAKESLKKYFTNEGSTTSDKDRSHTQERN